MGKRDSSLLLGILLGGGLAAYALLRKGVPTCPPGYIYDPELKVCVPEAPAGELNIVFTEFTPSAVGKTLTATIAADIVSTPAELPYVEVSLIVGDRTVAKSCWSDVPELGCENASMKAPNRATATLSVDLEEGDYLVRARVYARNASNVSKEAFTAAQTVSVGYPTCPPGQYYDPVKAICVDDPCPTGYHFDVESGLCVPDEEEPPPTEPHLELTLASLNVTKISRNLFSVDAGIGVSSVPAYLEYSTINITVDGSIVALAKCWSSLPEVPECAASLTAPVTLQTSGFIELPDGVHQLQAYCYARNEDQLEKALFSDAVTATAGDDEPPPENATLFVVNGPNGVTNPPAGGHTYALGTTVVIAAYPNTGYEIDYWTVDGVVNHGPSITLVMTVDHAVAAYFKLASQPPPPVEGVEIIPTKLNVTPVSGGANVEAEVSVQSEVPNLEYCTIHVRLDDSTVTLAECYSNLPEVPECDPAVTAPVVLRSAGFLSLPPGVHKLQIYSYARNGVGGSDEILSEAEEVTVEGFPA